MPYDYKVLPSAEAVDRRLSLIDENKNLLPYPYEKLYYENLPADLIDVGDGSILTAARPEGSETTILLNDCALVGGKTYIISLNITNILEEVISDSQFSLKVECSTDSSLAEDAITSSHKLDLSAKADDTTTTVLIYLNIPATFDASLLIKPQVEVQPIIDGIPSENPSNWVPNMDKIGTYVDRRFNGTNAKIKTLDDEIKYTNQNLSAVVSKLGNTVDQINFLKLGDLLACITIEDASETPATT